MDRLDDSRAVEIERGLFWIGFADYESGFSNNPYLLLDEDEAVLFDPGPGHPLFRDLAIRKIQEIASPGIIRYLVVHHADPDLCGMLPLIEDIVHPEAMIVCHPRTALFLPYYGIRLPILPVGDGDQLELKSGTRVEFHHTPYVHFAGSMVSFVRDRGLLFSSDIFGVFDREWKLHADSGYPELARSFLEHYVGDSESLTYAADLFEGLPVKKILPQHGGIIESGFQAYFDMMRSCRPGALIRELRSKGDAAALERLRAAVAGSMAQWMGGKAPSGGFSEMEEAARAKGTAILGMLYDTTAREARERGMANPYAYGKVHKRGGERGTRRERWMDRARSQLLTTQFSIAYGNEDALDQLLQRRFQAIQAKAVILFSDIRGFTAWSADRPPDQVIGALNKQHELAARIIKAQGGRINKVIGDGLLAYFPESRMAESVLVAILIAESARAEGLLPMGVGLEYGPVVMGDIGENARLDYTMVGQTVNAASRMCSAAASGQIAVGMGLWKALPEPMREAYLSGGKARPFSLRLKPGDPELEGVRIYPGPAEGVRPA